MIKIITTHLTVSARVDDLWDALTDLSGYHEWNPYITAASGTIDVGQRLDLTIQPPGGRATGVKPWVTAVEQHRYLEWLGRTMLPGVLDARHSFTLTPMSQGRILIQQSETYGGLATPFTRSLLSRTRDGFVAMNHALARHVVPAWEGG